MKILYCPHSPDTKGLVVEGGNVLIYAYGPAIVNPGEIIRVPTNLSLKTEAGYCLIITTHWGLTQRACQMFPALLIIDQNAPDKSLEIPIMNCGRNPLNIMPGQEIAIGKVVAEHPVELTPYEVVRELPKINKKSSPVKKNPNVKFEVK